jgi:hypothetical protein
MYGVLLTINYAQQPSGRAYGTFPDEILRQSHCGAESGSMGTKMTATSSLYHALLTTRRDVENCRRKEMGTRNVARRYMYLLHRGCDLIQLAGNQRVRTRRTQLPVPPQLASLSLPLTERADQRKTRTLAGHDRCAPCTPCQP